MSPFTIRRLLSPSDEEVDVCASLMYNLQKDVDAAVWLVGGEAILLKEQTAAGIRAAALSGEIYVAQNELGEIIAFSVWMPPGQEIFSTPEQRDLGFDDLIAKLPEDAKKYFLSTYLGEFVTFVGSLLGPTGKLDSWWMNLLMVRRDYQRQGVGTSLVNTVREKVQSLRMNFTPTATKICQASQKHELMACAAVEDSLIPVYEGMGFTHVGRKVMECQWGEWNLNIFSQVA